MEPITTALAVGGAASKAKDVGESAWDAIESVGDWFSGKTSRGEESKVIAQLGWKRIVGQSANQLFSQFMAVTGLQLGRSPEDYFYVHPQAPGIVLAQVGATKQAEWGRLGTYYRLPYKADMAKEDWVMVLTLGAEGLIPVAVYLEAEELPSTVQLAGAAVAAIAKDPERVAQAWAAGGGLRSWWEGLLYGLGLYKYPRRGIETGGNKLPLTAGSKGATLSLLLGGAASGTGKTTKAIMGNQTLTSLTQAYNATAKGSTAQKAAAQAICDFVNNQPGSAKMAVKSIGGSWVPVGV